MRGRAAFFGNDLQDPAQHDQPHRQQHRAHPTACQTFAPTRTTWPAARLIRRNRCEHVGNMCLRPRGRRPEAGDAAASECRRLDLQQQLLARRGRHTNPDGRRRAAPHVIATPGRGPGPRVGLQNPHTDAHISGNHLDGSIPCEVGIDDSSGRRRGPTPRCEPDLSSGRRRRAARRR